MQSVYLLDDVSFAVGLTVILTVNPEESPYGFTVCFGAIGLTKSALTNAHCFPLNKDDVLAVVDERARSGRDLYKRECRCLQ